MFSDKCAEKARVCRKARSMLGYSRLETHPYLETKGLVGVKGHVLEEKLLVPVHDFWTGSLNSLQVITEDGSKKNLTKGRMKDCVYLIGNPGPYPVLVEGYATGLTAKAALDELGVDAPVLVCFSDSVLKKIGRACRKAVVVADNDEKGAGERAARYTGHPYWMSPTVGFDMNDHFMEYGMESVLETFRDLIVTIS